MYIICWILLIPLLFCAAIVSHGQTNHSLSVNGKFSKTIFGKPLIGVRNEMNVKYYVPSAFGLGTEVAYSFRKGKFAIGGNVGMTNMKFTADEYVNYDVYLPLSKTLSALFLEIQIMGKRILSMGDFETHLELGIGSSHHMINYHKRPILTMNEWGLQTLAGVSMRFPINDNFSIVLGTRVSYQVNRFFRQNESLQDIFQLNNFDKNNTALHLFIGAKFRIFGKGKYIHSGRHII